MILYEIGIANLDEKQGTKIKDALPQVRFVTDKLQCTFLKYNAGDPRLLVNGKCTFNRNS